LADVEAAQQFVEAENGEYLEVAEAVMAKDIRVFHFDSDTQQARDISALDTETGDSGVDGWGGLSEFSSRVNEAVGRVADQGQVVDDPLRRHAARARPRRTGLRLERIWQRL